MAEPEEGGLIKCVESFLADKQEMATREAKLIEDLNAALERMGYRVVPFKAASGAATGKKRGRPPGSGKAAPVKAVSASA